MKHNLSLEIEFKYISSCYKSFVMTEDYSVVVYGDKKATCTQRVLILLEELGLTYEFTEVNLQNNEQKSKDFLSMNPLGQVPVVKYTGPSGDTKTLFESRSILRYIATKHDDNVDFYPDVYTDVWLEVESQKLNPLLSTIVYEKIFRKAKGESCDERVVEEALGKLQNVLDIFEKRLEQTTYLSGGEFSIADISAIPYLRMFVRCGSIFKETLKSRKHLYKWLKRVCNRPEVKKILQ